MAALETLRVDNAERTERLGHPLRRLHSTEAVINVAAYLP